MMSKESILIMEDEEDIAELLTYNLAKEGYRVTAVGSGEEGLKAAQAALPDLVVLDLIFRLLSMLARRPGLPR